MRKIVLLIVLGYSLLFASVNLQTATKSELMSIKGIGDKKAEQIIEYRKRNTIKSPDDLKNINGFGDTIVNNVKKNIKSGDNLKKSQAKDVKNPKKEEKIKKVQENKSNK